MFQSYFLPPEFAMRTVILFPLMYPCSSEMRFDPRDVVSPAARPQLALQGTFFTLKTHVKALNADLSQEMMT